ncbi:hypothetical protein LOK49_LG03G01838 [Camellia lanceoleosa]|uniref:Uncharacterized protein n=1 Tax=Camellia lanceoleosa TaxID=1840588 RepID=A0ACC0IDV9_9ERIC|nr:hypothetical protein LOK49_LG03G01838 [Camellia lanceoleosa]
MVVHLWRSNEAGLLGHQNWHNQPYSGNGTGYGEYDNYHRDDSFTEPAMINQDGGKDRCLAGNMSKHPSHGPTNDIGQALEILKEEAKTSPVSVATALVSTVPKRDTYTTNPESRYFSLTTMPGNFSLSTMPGNFSLTSMPGNFNLSSRPC